MIRYRGTVLRVEGGLAWVECTRGGPCALCPGRNACEMAALAAPSRHRLRARTAGLAFAPGTDVIVGVQPGAVLRAALLAYAVPLSGLLAGAAAGAAAAPALAYVGAGLGLLIGVVAAGRAARRTNADTPVIVDILPS